MSLKRLLGRQIGCRFGWLDRWLAKSVGQDDWLSWLAEDYADDYSVVRELRYAAMRDERGCQS